MQIRKLKNGLTVVYFPRKRDTVAVNVSVNVGSNDERSGIRGISHFIEHMLFEGTKKRPNSLAIASEIENLGGEFNAFTNNERTAYYIRMPKQYAKNAIEVVADMVIHSTFKPEFIKKEKTVVLNEIGAMYDDPRQYQWVLFESTLYQKSVLQHPIIGYKQDIRAMSRAKVLAYYKKYYVPSNMVLTIVGEVKNPFGLAAECFDFTRMGSKNKRKAIAEPQKQKETTKDVKKKLNQAYVIVGFHSIPSTHKDAVVFEVIRSILGRGFSGWLFEEIRNKRGLAYDMGIHNESKINYGYFSAYASIKKESVEEVKDIFRNEIGRLASLKPKDLADAKRYLLGELVMGQEDNVKLADTLAYLSLASKATQLTQKAQHIRAVSLEDVKRVTKKYLQHPTFLVLR